MTEKKGHFEQGKWVEEPAQPPGEKERAAMEARISDASTNAITAIDNVMNVTRDLITTDEGRQYLEKMIAGTKDQANKTFNEMISPVNREIEAKVPSKK